MVCRLYVPFGSFCPSIFTSSLNEIVVASFAPVRQTLSYGTRSPQMVRPFTPGRLYLMVMSVRPTVWVSVADGLGRGVRICAKALVVARRARAAMTVLRIISSFLLESARMLAEDAGSLHRAPQLVEMHGFDF